MENNLFILSREADLFRLFFDRKYNMASLLVADAITLFTLQPEQWVFSGLKDEKILAPAFTSHIISFMQGSDRCVFMQLPAFRVQLCSRFFTVMLR